MKILYLYRYGILGGVCTQLFHRFRHMSKIDGIEIHCGFRSDHGVTSLLEEFATLHFGLNKETTEEFLKEKKFDIIVIIDTEEYIEAVRNVNHESLILVEVHTSIERNLEYLSRIEPGDVDGFVTVSNYMVGRIKYYIQDNMGDVSISIFTNVLDSVLFENVPIKVEGPPIVGWVGKIDDHKDWKAFMEISRMVNEVRPETEFWIIGGQTCPESTAQEVFDLAEEKGIISRFRWIDRIENTKMSSLYSIISQRNGLSLVTSHCESFGMSVLESLLSGCPVVSTNVGALPEITNQDQYFELYELGEYDIAVNKIVKILDSSDSVNAKLLSIRQNLVELYDSSSRSKDYWNMLTEMKVNG